MMNGRNGTCQVLLCATALSCAALPAFAEPRPEAAKSTLYSGVFDDFLMIAADHDDRTISGYYDDGKCRFVLGDALTPISLDQRSDFGEAYSVRSWEPGHPDRVFRTILYAQPKNGFQSQITLEPGQEDVPPPAKCRSRITLDRAYNVSSGFYGVRVIRTSRPTVFDVVRADSGTKLVVKRQRPLARGTGVWAARTYSAAYSPAGYVYINWYDPPGTPQGGYVRVRHLYRLPTPPVPDSPAP